jgi:hypothetical protein
MAKSERKKRELRATLKELHAQHYAHMGLDHPPLSDRRYQVMQWVGVCGDENGNRFLFLITGDPKWYLCYPLLGDSGVVINGDGFPVKRSTLPRLLRSALAHGWCNSRMPGLAGVMEEARKAAWQSERRAVITYGPEEAPIDSVWVENAIKEAKGLQPKPSFLIFASRSITDKAVEIIESMKIIDGITLLSFPQKEVEETNAEVKK